MNRKLLSFVAVAFILGAALAQGLAQRAYAADMHAAALEYQRAYAADLHAVANEFAAQVRTLSLKNTAEETRAFTLSTATTALKPSSNLTYQAYQCTTDASTSAGGVYVVTAGTATATTTNGYGPFCSDTTQCPLGATIVGDSGAVSVQAASGTPALRCRFGLAP